MTQFQSRCQVFTLIKFVSYLLSNSAPHDPAMFFGIGVSAFATESGSGIVFGRSTLHPMSPHSVVRRLAGVRYQLDFELPQAGIVERGHQQEDPAFESPCKYAYTDAILPNVLTPLASRFETDAIR